MLHDLLLFAGIALCARMMYCFDFWVLLLHKTVTAEWDKMKDMPRRNKNIFLPIVSAIIRTNRKGSFYKIGTIRTDFFFVCYSRISHQIAKSHCSSFLFSIPLILSFLFILCLSHTGIIMLTFGIASFFQCKYIYTPLQVQH